MVAKAARVTGAARTGAVLHATKARSWTDAEDAFLVEYYPVRTREQIAFLLGRTKGSVRKRCSVLGLNSKHPLLTKAEEDAIRQWYTERSRLPKGEFDLGKLAESLGRTKAFISRTAKAMGLTLRTRKHSKQMSQEKGQRSKRLIAEKGHPKGMLGKRHTEEMKKKHGEKVKKGLTKLGALDWELMAQKRNKTNLERYGTGNPSMRGTNGYTRARGGRRADLDNQYFRSAWEANYARYLNWLKSQGKIASWEYEPYTFVFHGVTRGALSYTPDFKVLEIDGTYLWHEVKGWMDSKSKTKLKRMAKYYPDETIVLIESAQYKDISKWASLIPGWEF